MPPLVRHAESPDARAVSPVVGAVLLVGLTVVLAAGVGAVALGTATERLPERAGPPPVTLSLSAEGTRLTLVHERGPALDVRELDVRVAVDGIALAHQPPVPFFAARGFRSGPTGPFNPASDPHWTAGERATLRIAGTNTPVHAGDTVTVTLTRSGRPVARASATVRPSGG